MVCWSKRAEDSEQVFSEINTCKVVWEKEAEDELKKIPFFVRGKARKNTESFASSRGFSKISIETLYDAKAFHAR